MRIVFMGTPAFAVKSLEACLSLGEVVAVVTQPDKPRGRGQEEGRKAMVWISDVDGNCIGRSK